MEIEEKDLIFGEWLSTMKLRVKVQNGNPEAGFIQHPTLQQMYFRDVRKVDNSQIKIGDYYMEPVFERLVHVRTEYKWFDVPVVETDSDDCCPK